MATFDMNLMPSMFQRYKVNLVMDTEQARSWLASIATKGRGGSVPGFAAGCPVSMEARGRPWHT